MGTSAGMTETPSYTHNVWTVLSHTTYILTVLLRMARCSWFGGIDHICLPAGSLLLFIRHAKNVHYIHNHM